MYTSNLAFYKFEKYEPMLWYLFTLGANWYNQDPETVKQKIRLYLSESRRRDAHIMVKITLKKKKVGAFPVPDFRTYNTPVSKPA